MALVAGTITVVTESRFNYR